MPAWLSTGPPLTLQAAILLSTDTFIFLLQCYISAHKRQAEDKETWAGQTKLKTIKRLFVCDNYMCTYQLFLYFPVKKSLKKYVIHNLLIFFFCFLFGLASQRQQHILGNMVSGWLWNRNLLSRSPRLKSPTHPASRWEGYPVHPHCNDTLKAYSVRSICTDG